MGGLATLLQDACAAGMSQRDWSDLPAFFENEAALTFHLAPVENA